MIGDGDSPHLACQVANHQSAGWLPSYPTGVGYRHWDTTLSGMRKAKTCPAGGTRFLWPQIAAVIHNSSSEDLRAQSARPHPPRPPSCDTEGLNFWAAEHLPADLERGDTCRSKAQSPLRPGRSARATPGELLDDAAAAPAVGEDTHGQAGFSHQAWAVLAAVTIEHPPTGYPSSQRGRCWRFSASSSQAKPGLREQTADLSPESPVATMSSAIRRRSLEHRHSLSASRQSRLLDLPTGSRPRWMGS
jgi:hypothetical protein